MSDDTLQWVYKVGAIAFAVAMLLILGAMVGGVFYFGDGEGLGILNSLSGPFLSMLGTIVALLAPHQIASAWAKVRITPPALPVASDPAPASVASGQGD